MLPRIAHAISNIQAKFLPKREIIFAFVIELDSTIYQQATAQLLLHIGGVSFLEFLSALLKLFALFLLTFSVSLLTQRE